MPEQEDQVEISFTPDDDESTDDAISKRHKAHAHHKAKKKPSLKKLQEKLNEQEEIIANVVKERDEYKDKYLRTLAEIDNFRKRVKKEKDEYQRYVLGEFLLDLLQVFDNLERALKARTPSQKQDSVLTLLVDDDEKSIISGVEMIYKQFSDLLKRYKVVEIDALGKPFDPNIHQALSKDERDDVKEPMVLEVYQKGFLYNGKLLRPTLAKVAIPKPQEQEAAESQEEEAEAEE